MKKEIKGKFYDLSPELVEYIEELEYYHNYSIGKKVIEIHSGITGDIILMFKNFYDIPKDVLPNPNEYIDKIKHLIQEGHKKIQWIAVKQDDEDAVFIFPFPFWRILEPNGIDLRGSDDSEDFDGEIAPNE
jgi:hypothetical protein